MVRYVEKLTQCFRVVLVCTTLYESAFIKRLYVFKGASSVYPRRETCQKILLWTATNTSKLPCSVVIQWPGNHFTGVLFEGDGPNIEVLVKKLTLVAARSLCGCYKDEITRDAGIVNPQGEYHIMSASGNPGADSFCFLTCTQHCLKNHWEGDTVLALPMATVAAASSQLRVLDPNYSFQFNRLETQKHVRTWAKLTFLSHQ